MTFLHSWSHYTPSWAHSAHKTTILNKKKCIKIKRAVGGWAWGWTDLTTVHFSSVIMGSNFLVFIPWVSQFMWHQLYVLLCPEPCLTLLNSVELDQSLPESQTPLVPLVSHWYSHKGYFAGHRPVGLRAGYQSMVSILRSSCDGVKKAAGASLQPDLLHTGNEPHHQRKKHCKIRNLTVLPSVIFACPNSWNYCWNVCTSSQHT